MSASSGGFGGYRFGTFVFFQNCGTGHNKTADPTEKILLGRGENVEELVAGCGAT